MADGHLPLLRGRIDRVDEFRTVFGGTRDAPPLPARDPARHRANLLHQLDHLVEQVAERDVGLRVEGATRELVSILPDDKSVLSPKSLADRNSDARLVSVDEDTGVAILDVQDPALPHLRRKVDWFADDSKVNEKTGARRSAPAIAPISQIHLTRLNELAGNRVRSASLPSTATRWFEIACRGGYRDESSSSATTRFQLRRALGQLGVTNIQEYEATERLVFFVRCSLSTVEQLLDMVDCIYELDLASPDVRPFLMYEGDLQREIQQATIVPPAPGAPAVALLESGIATQHPLLRNLIAGAVCVVPGYESSAEDTHGHGTEMAGVAAYSDVADVIDNGGVAADHWLESARVWIGESVATARDEHRAYWPQLTVDAVNAVETLGDRPRVFATAIAAELDTPGRPTYWSHAVDRLAYNNGAGRVFFVCSGNADSSNVGLLDGYPTMNLEQKLWDPSQAVNAITVGAYTTRTTMPPGRDFEGYAPVAPAAGISPHTSAGPVPGGDAIKPDVVFEGGNVAFDGRLPDPAVPTLAALTTSHKHTSGRPLSLLWATSEATARAAWFGAQLRRRHPALRPETLRGLVVHSASWSERMLQQFPNIDERLAICGLGVPDLALAASCARHRTTVIVEDEIPNANRTEVPREKGKSKERFTRALKAFRMPLPEEILLGAGDATVELRVTLSYFAEPNTFKRHLQRGLDLKWDMQGLQESETQFLARINRLARGRGKREDSTKPLPWDLGIRRRSRGTVQSDRWSGPASLLAGNKLVAVYPSLGWWDRRKALRTASMRFSLIVTVRGPEIELYETIATELEAVIAIGT